MLSKKRQSDSKTQDSLNGTEHVTLPVNEFSWFHDGAVVLAEIAGTKKVSVLSGSISNTLLDS